MQIQKGLVKYKDRSDIVCTYGITDEGKQYYFLDGNNLPNGYIIASTALVEAIDPMVECSAVGVINQDGRMIIPFENKSIKVISNDMLLVERAMPLNPTVLEAIQLRSDPLAATKLVTTPATIKDKINSSMGVDGRFVFNDQFSEATIYDINGNNLLNNEYYSFIAMNKNKLYFSKNTTESPVMEYVFANDEAISVDEVPTEEVSDIPKLDIENTSVSKDEIDDAINAQNQEDVQTESQETEGVNEVQNALGGEINIPIAGDVTSETIEAINKEESEETPAEEETSEVSSDEVDNTNGEIVEESKVEDETSDDSLESDKKEDENSEDSNNDENLVNEESSETEENQSVEEVSEDVANNEETEKVMVSDEEVSSVVDSDSNENDEKENLDNNSEEVSEEVENNDVKEDFVQIDDEVKFDIDSSTKDDFDIDFDNIATSNKDFDVVENKQNFSEFSLDTINFDDDSDSDYNNSLFGSSNLDNNLLEKYNGGLEFDSILNNDNNIVDDYTIRYSNNGVIKDTIIEDVATTMSNLIKSNRNQKKHIDKCKSHINQLNSAGKRLLQKTKVQERELDSLKNKLKNYEVMISKLESKNQVLESKVNDQEKLIVSQTNELDMLRPQVEGKKDLVRLIEDAQSLLSQDK